jgi:ribA/ribD-fused uncharacterized protein
MLINLLTDEPIRYIDSFRGEYFFLSNFYPVEIEIGDKLYQSSEHYYQAMKCKREEDHEKIRLCKSPGSSKREVLLYEHRENWSDIKLVVMENVLRVKFSDTELKNKLKKTSEYNLREVNTWNDKFWGIDKITMKGDNHLGRLLMKIRDEK